mgnify:FL=1
MSLLQMSFLGTVIILLIVVLRAVLINRLPKKTFLILWWIALIRLLVPFSIKSVTSIYSLLQSIYSDINPVRTAQTTTFLPIHGNMPEIANGLSEAMVQRTESISILSVIWLAGLLLCFGFFAVSYIKCYREFRFSLPVENDILEAWKEKTSTKKESIHPADRNHSCTTFLWCDSPSYFNAKKYRMEKYLSASLCVGT